MSTQQLSPSEYAKMKRQEMNEINDKIHDGLTKISNVENYKRFLATMSKFYHYTWRNQLLIDVQNPDATFVARYDTWKKYNRHVQKGEKGIQILAPHKYTVQNEDGLLVQRIGYRPAYVFDVSQTKGDPLPDLFKVQEQNGVIAEKDTIINSLKRLSKFNITYEPIEEGNSYCDYDEKKIVLNEKISDVLQLKAAINEVAQRMIKNDELEEQKKFEADSVTFVVMNRLGLDTSDSDYNLDYVQIFEPVDELKSMMQSLEIIQKTSQRIINEVEQALERYREERNVSEMEQRKEQSQLNEAAKDHVQDLNAVDNSEEKVYPSISIRFSEHPGFKEHEAYSILELEEKLKIFEAEVQQQQDQFPDNDDLNRTYKLSYTIHYDVDGQKGDFYGQYEIGSRYDAFIHHLTDLVEEQIDYPGNFKLKPEREHQLILMRDKVIPLLIEGISVESNNREQQKMAQSHDKAKEGSKAEVKEQEKKSTKKSIKERAAAASAKKKSSKTRNTREQMKNIEQSR